MKLQYRRAEPEDLELVVETRLEVLRAANGLPEDAPLPEVEAESRAYFRRALGSGEALVELAFAGAEFVAAGGVSFYRVMPTVHNPDGRKAYIMNMYVRPAYRRRGIARNMLDRLVRAARARGVDHITLEATAMGRPLYEAYGFVGMAEEMELPKSNVSHLD